MKEYKVIWEIEVIASSPEHAANLAKEIQLDKENLASVFLIIDSDGNKTTVDTEGRQT